MQALGASFDRERARHIGMWILRLVVLAVLVAALFKAMDPCLQPVIDFLKRQVRLIGG